MSTWPPSPNLRPGPLPISIWLVPALAVAVLWTFSDAALNRALFLSINGWAATQPAVFWADLTLLGDTLVALCLALPLLRKRPDLVLAILLASIPATLLSNGLKVTFAMPRPVLALGDLVNVIGDNIRGRTSFPSGHTTTIFLFAGVLAAGLRQQARVWMVVAIASLVGFSRIAVGAHWPADIAGGALCGWFSGLFGHYLAQHWSHLRTPRILAGIRLFLVVATLHLLFFYDSDVDPARPFQHSLALIVLAFHLWPGWRLTPPHSPIGSRVE